MTSSWTPTHSLSTFAIQIIRKNRGHDTKLTNLQTHENCLVSFQLDLLYISHNAPVQYLTMRHFVTEMCTREHISLTKWCIVVYLSDAMWNLYFMGRWTRDISKSYKVKHVNKSRTCIANPQFLAS